MILPNTLVLAVLVLGILYMLLVKKQYLDSLYGALAGGGFFLLLYLVTRGNMGGGDIKLIAALGVWLGLKATVMTTLLAFVIGAVASVAVLIKNKGGRKLQVPFGPYIAIACVISFCWCSNLIEWYLGFFEFL
jgi:leader peptidase (prepilin peptidase)/N-methyltransferase